MDLFNLWLKIPEYLEESRDCVIILYSLHSNRTIE
jgi:hypothetical protein